MGPRATVDPHPAISVRRVSWYYGDRLLLSKIV
jgi:hypothetical protein